MGLRAPPQPRLPWPLPRAGPRRREQVAASMWHICRPQTKCCLCRAPRRRQSRPQSCRETLDRRDHPAAASWPARGMHTQPAVPDRVQGRALDLHRTAAGAQQATGQRSCNTLSSPAVKPARGLVLSCPCRANPWDVGWKNDFTWTIRAKLLNL